MRSLIRHIAWTLALVLFPADNLHLIHADESWQSAEIAAQAGQLERLARSHDGSASPENLERARKYREVLNQVASRRKTKGTTGEEAWKLLERELCRKERNAAMEAALVLIRFPESRARDLLFSRLGEMDGGVRRAALERLRIAGIDLQGNTSSLLAAGVKKLDPESLAIWVRLASSLGSVDAARAVLGASPPPPRESRESRKAPGSTGSPMRAKPWRPEWAADKHDTLRQAILDSLKAATSRDVVRWLSIDAWDEAARQREPDQLYTLALTVVPRRSQRVRAHLFRQLQSKSPALRLAALDNLLAMRTGKTRTDLRALMMAENCRPEMRAQIAASLPRDQALLVMSYAKTWPARRAATIAFAAMPRSAALFKRLFHLLAKDENREVRRVAAATLRYFRRKEAIPRTIELLAPLRARDTDAVLGYLRWASGDHQGESIKSWKGWWSEVEAKYEFPAPPSTGGNKPDAQPRPRRSP